MKKSNLLSLTLFILVSSFFLTDCSKDKKIERTLYKKEGTWAVTSVNWEQVQQDTSGQSIYTGTTASAGTFTFDKDGSGSYNFTVNGTNYSQTFSWSVDNEKISITKVGESFNLSGNFDQLAVAISGTQSSKTNISL
ncbi:MAG TPA: hypothetical protein VFJ43_10615, partial [Bacteroidia bacterium]|nr:hypothetical protein [Bacteroidia bacterium]